MSLTDTAAALPGKSTRYHAKTPIDEAALRVAYEAGTHSPHMIADTYRISILRLKRLAQAGGWVQKKPAIAPVVLPRPLGKTRT